MSKRATPPIRSRPRRAGGEASVAEPTDRRLSRLLGLLLEHPMVRECAAVASPDEVRGEIVKAFVVLAGDAEGSEALAAELQDHVKRLTAPYKYPRAVEFVAELPKNASGKLLRKVLRDQEYAAKGEG